MGVVVAFMGALAYVVRVYARLVELGAETPGKNPYVAEMYKLHLKESCTADQFHKLICQAVNKSRKANTFFFFFCKS
jgi:Na+-transporting methylmalonyl-CoA/oxaloacetate decarboxylase gamma subunit